MTTTPPPPTAPPPIQYPTHYTFKVMGKQGDDFAAYVLAVFKRVLGPDLELDWKSQESRQGTYLSLSVTVFLTSEAQREGVYGELHGDPRIVYYL